MVQVDPNFWQTLADLFINLGQLLGMILAFAGRYILIITWVVWWLWAVNWQRCWEALARGAWASIVLLMLMAALVWSRLEHAPCECLVVVTIPNFWWQLGEVALLGAIALFCGWLQGVFHWTPAEIDLAPPVHGFEHVHEHH
jgi:hypothetical protein